MSDVKDLTKRRASFKGRVTVFTNYLFTISKPITESVARELQLRLGKLESLYEKYDDVQLQLECSAENMESKLTERAEFEKFYYKALTDAQGILNEFNKSHTTKKCSNGNSNRLVKLPTIQLPKFSGSYDNWLEFRDTFTSLIHCNREIDEINKFHYLRASLEGSAAVVIHSVQFSASNYAIAWKLLCERFDIKRLLIQNHISALFNLEVITKESSIILKRLIDQLNKNLRALEALGEPVTYWDTLLIYIVTQKLDQRSYREWEEYKGNLGRDVSINFEIFLQFLRNRADLLETLELSRSNQSIGLIKPIPKLKSMLAQNSFNARSENSPQLCCKCQGEHALNNCPQFLALSNEARFETLPSFKVCFNCFKSGHFANTCKKPGCRICKRRHNVLVHVAESKSVMNTPPDNQVVA
nr:uncharacterized protein LOC128669669 [Plodia interpunctella]